MTNDKVDEVLRHYASLISFAQPARAEATARCDGIVEGINHAAWMIQEALTWGPERVEKKFRWLGFIQGVLWAFGATSIETAKRANMPDEEKTS